MTRRFVMTLVTLAALGGGAALAWSMHTSRNAQIERYVAARAQLRKAVTATRRPTPAPAPPPPQTRDRMACVKMADTFVVAAERSQPLPAPGKGKRLAELRALSDAAVRAEREAELARPAPTLPKRMGVGADKLPITPEKHACDGAGYAEVELPQSIPK
jgi:hypothetical protein